MEWDFWRIYYYTILLGVLKGKKQFGDKKRLILDPIKYRILDGSIGHTLRLHLAKVQYR